MTAPGGDPFGTWLLEQIELDLKSLEVQDGFAEIIRLESSGRTPEGAPAPRLQIYNGERWVVLLPLRENYDRIVATKSIVLKYQKVVQQHADLLKIFRKATTMAGVTKSTLSQAEYTLHVAAVRVTTLHEMLVEIATVYRNRPGWDETMLQKVFATE